MTRKEPSGEAVLAARAQRAYPSLNPWQCASLATEICAIERAQRRHAERCCSGSDGGYVKYRRARADQHGGLAVDAEHDPVAEERAGKRIGDLCSRWINRLREWLAPYSYTVQNRDLWLETETKRGEPLGRCRIELQGDPRGAVLKVQFPGETEARSV